jgi:hypothetical protein
MLFEQHILNIIPRMTQLEFSVTLLKPVTSFHERRKVMKSKTSKAGITINVPSLRFLVLAPLSFVALLMLFVLFNGSPANAGLTSEREEASAEFVPGVIMVKFGEGVKVEMEMREGHVTTDIPSIDALNKKHGVREFVKIFSPEPKSEKARTIYRDMGLDRVYQFCTSPKADVLTMAAEYKADPSVEYAEPDYVGHAHLIPNDPWFGRQWGLYNTGFNPPDHPGTYDADIDVTEAWDFWWGASGVVLAFLDTGIDSDHPDLSSVIWRVGQECWYPHNGVDDDGNGYVDDCGGFDFVNGYQSGGVWYNDANGPEDDNGHGTVSAGIAGAVTHNNVGVAGMFPPLSGNYSILPVKVIRSNGSFDYDKLEAGIYYAANNGAKVINMSLGGEGYSQALLDAVNYAWYQGSVLVASMGNCNDSTPMYPARFYNTIAVGGTDTDDSRCDTSDWSFMSWDPICGSIHGSNYGSHIDVVAPGNWIYSTDLGATYGYYAGTSVAAPFVSGLAALIISERLPGLPPDTVRQIIQSTADDRVGLPSEDTPGWDQYHGWGRINAKRALGIPAPAFHEDFNDCNLNGWAVYTSSGTFATDTSQWVSPHCGLHVSSPEGGYAYGMTKTLYLDTTQNFTIITYFKVPTTDNHWLLVLDNNWVSLVIDGGTNLLAWQGSHGGIKHLATLNTNQWYTIKIEVKPAFSSYNVYLDWSYVDYAYFLRDGDGKMFPYLRLGDIYYENHGEGYWDDLLVYGKKTYVLGDVNGDTVIDVGDVVYIINYLFKGGLPPNPVEAGDVNCDGVVDVGDVVYLINYLFKGGPAPSC